MSVVAEAPTDAAAIACGVASRPLPGETESGDAHLVVPFRGGVLIAVVDGLGHGSEAASAARIAIASLRENPELAVDELVRRCHAALYKTRGVVLGLGAIDATCNRLSWVGVGNIDATLVRADQTGAAAREVLQNRGGVVGHQMPSLRVTTHPIAPGDTLVLATDGIDGRLRVAAPFDWPPQELADYIVARHAKATDDALALVVRYEGCRSR